MSYTIHVYRKLGAHGLKLLMRETFEDGVKALAIYEHWKELGCRVDLFTRYAGRTKIVASS